MLTTLGVGLVAAQPASAAPTPVVSVRTTADAKTHVGALVNTDVEIPQGTFTGSYNTDTKAITGSTNLPQADFSYTALGFLPISVSFNVAQVSPGTTGTLDLTTGDMSITHNFDVVLTSVRLFGLLEILDPATVCKTVTPTSSVLTTDDFSIAEGGVLTGNYAIPALAGCGFLEAFVSAFTAGPTNSLEVTLGPPVLG